MIAPLGALTGVRARIGGVGYTLVMAQFAGGRAGVLFLQLVGLGAMARADAPAATRPTVLIVVGA
jgi:hypothetical protein